VQWRGVMNNNLPKNLKAFFWDYDFNLLSWRADKDLIISRSVWQKRTSP
jgi:hypothetical protein